MAVRVEVRAIRAEGGRMWLDLLVIGTRSSWHQLTAVGIPLKRIDPSVVREIILAASPSDETPREPEDTLPLW